MSRSLSIPMMVSAADDRRIERNPETTMTVLGRYTLLGTTLLRTSILGAAVVALLAVSAGDARANQSGPDVNAANQQRLCRFFGGTVAPEDITADRTNAGGLTSTGTVCKGGSSTA